MPPSEAIPAMQTFCAPMIEQVHALVSRPGATAPKSDLTACSDALERLNIFLNINSHLSDSLPNECASTANDIWQILDGLLQKYGNSSVAERACSTIRRGLTFFGRLALPLAPAILDRMTAAFEQGGVSGYVWIAGRVPELLRLPQVDETSQNNLKTHLAQTFNSMTAKLATMLSASSPADVQDCTSRCFMSNGSYMLTWFTCAKASRITYILSET
jgi:transportin-3